MFLQQFNELLQTLRRNQTIAQKASGLMDIDGIDIMEAIAVSQGAMERIARSVQRSANVGIGYAYSAKYARDAIARVLAQGC